MDRTQNIIRTKCAIVGDPTVGKTALTQMFITGGQLFPKNYSMTLGVDLSVKKIKIPDTECSVEFYLYDSSGRDIYSVYLPKYWHGPNVVLAVFDVTSEESLNSVVKWVTFARETISEDLVPSTPIVLFGNKTDLVDRRVVSPRAGEAMAEKLGLHYFEGSAKDNIGTVDPFYLLAYEWHKLCEMNKDEMA